MPSSYAFDDTDVAARRLALLATVFAPSSVNFLHRAITSDPKLIVDLGCGPGHTTHLLTGLFPQSRVVGLDSSARFIALADRTHSERISFHQHDVAQIPFPIEPADLLFCRYLVTHLTKPQQILLGWATQLRSGGRLLMEEVEAIHTVHPAFVSYLEIVAAMLRHQSNELYVGPVLVSIAQSREEGSELQVHSNQVYTLPVSNAEAAGMFALNIQVWRENSFIQEHYAAAAITDLTRQLTSLSNDATGTSDITWELRQIALRRA